MQAANFASVLQSFFSTRLIKQRDVSPNTIAAYRDTFRLLLRFAGERLDKAPSQLSLEALDATLVSAFLHDPETRRGNGPRSRNLRLTAIRSFFRYATLEVPEHAGTCQRVLAIPRQTGASSFGGLPEPSRDCSPVGGARSGHVTGTPRLCIHAHGHSDRFAFIRADGVEKAGRVTTSWRACSLSG